MVLNRKTVVDLGDESAYDCSSHVLYIRTCVINPLMFTER